MTLPAEIRQDDEAARELRAHHHRDQTEHEQDRLEHHFRANSAIKACKVAAVFSLEISNELSRLASCEEDADLMHPLLAPTPTETRYLARR
jgi:hypothetical protein